MANGQKCLDGKAGNILWPVMVVGGLGAFIDFLDRQPDGSLVNASPELAVADRLLDRLGSHH